MLKYIGGCKMAVNDPNFEENVKLSFIKMKEHVNSLEIRMKDLEGKMINILNLFISFKEDIEAKLELKMDKNGKIDYFKGLSIGNEGVQSINQTINQSLNQSNNQSITKQSSTLTDLKEIEKLFKTIPKQELLLYLTVYQFEEDKKEVTYTNVAEKLNLTQSCIRAYVSSLLQKKVPLIKKRVNNKLIILTIPQYFKDLGVYPRLLNLYYGNDPNQSKLK